MQTLTEGKSEKKGCLMFNVKHRVSNWGIITDMINVEDIYNDETGDYGIETNPHVTVLYGISPTIKHEEVKQFVLENVKDDIQIRLTGISLFEGGDSKPYDVVKFTVESEDLVNLNNLLKEHFPYESTFPDYKPHMTIAYVKAGEGQKYVLEKLKNTEIKGKTFEYSIGHENTIKF